MEVKDAVDSLDRDRCVFVAIGPCIAAEASAVRQRLPRGRLRSTRGFPWWAHQVGSSNRGKGSGELPSNGWKGDLAGRNCHSGMPQSDGERLYLNQLADPPQGTNVMWNAQFS